MVGLGFESGLDSRILGDVSGEPGALPLLEFVLTGLWEARRGGQLHHAAYDAMGGVQGAMAQRAEEAWDRLKTRHEAAIETLFLQLVHAGEGAADTRRRVPLQELGDEARLALAELTKARLLVTARDAASGEETVEVAHEALIRHWGRLKGWPGQNRDFLAWRERLGVAVTEWEHSQRQESALLLRGAPLKEAERWLAERGPALSDPARAFIRASRVAARRGRRLTAAAAAVLTLAFGLLGYRYWLETQGLDFHYQYVRVVNALGGVVEPEMVAIQPGKFWMGAEKSLDADAQRDELPRHRVTIGKPFAIGRYELTFAEYDQFARAKEAKDLPDDQNWGRAGRPVVNVSWEDAVAYAKWLSEQTGKRYRLPTEAAWEYAARAGTETAYWWGDEVGKNNANCYGCGSQWDNKQTAPVGSFKANPRGLQDTAGSVYEWVQDCWHDNYKGAPEDGAAWEAGDCAQRVVRGGSWPGLTWLVRSAKRLRRTPASRNGDLGFRLAQAL